MGGSQSVQYSSYPVESDQDVQNRIKLMFSAGNHVGHNAKYSLAEMRNQNQLEGGQHPRKNRYAQYENDLSNALKGGSNGETVLEQKPAPVMESIMEQKPNPNVVSLDIPTPGPFQVSEGLSDTSPMIPEIKPEEISATSPMNITLNVPKDLNIKISHVGGKKKEKLDAFEKEELEDEEEFKPDTDEIIEESDDDDFSNTSATGGASEVNILPFYSSEFSAQSEYYKSMQKKGRFT